MTTEISDDALRAEVRAWLKANYRPEELRGATLWSSTPETRAWLTKVLEAGWATPRWPAEWWGRSLPEHQARIVEREFAAGALADGETLASEVLGADGSGRDGLAVHVERKEVAATGIHVFAGGDEADRHAFADGIDDARRQGGVDDIEFAVEQEGDGLLVTETMDFQFKTGAAEKAQFVGEIGGAHRPVGIQGDLDNGAALGFG